MVPSSIRLFVPQTRHAQTRTPRLVPTPRQTWWLPLLFLPTRHTPRLQPTLTPHLSPTARCPLQRTSRTLTQSQLCRLNMHQTTIATRHRHICLRRPCLLVLHGTWPRTWIQVRREAWFRQHKQRTCTTSDDDAPCIRCGMVEGQLVAVIHRESALTAFGHGFRNVD